MRSLCDLKTGEKATVDSLANESGMRRRLMDIGLVEGTVVERVGKSPAGDPSAYRVCGAVIALRREDAQKVLVQTLEPEGGDGDGAR